MSQTTLFDDWGRQELTSNKVARDSDPDTSHAGAAAVGGRLAGARREFIGRLRDLGKPSTAEEVAHHGEHSDTVRKRAGELIRAGRLFVHGRRACAVTGNAARTLWIEEPGK